MLVLQQGLKVETIAFQKGIAAVAADAKIVAPSIGLCPSERPLVFAACCAGWWLVTVLTGWLADWHQFLHLRV